MSDIRYNNSNLRESELMPKEEDGNGGKKVSPNPNLMTSSWSKFKDPRIVRVSRAFGGKDRHSKVYTVKGLRDRRVRLSVPTAIQLYDLQDRLGLSQPSKVVDWLLDVAKHEIDELPPLQMPFGNFVATQSENLEMVKSSNNGVNWEDYWNNPNKSKEKDHFFVQSSNQSSSMPIMFNNVMPNGSFLTLNPSNLSLSQFGSYNHQEDTATQLLMYPPPSDHDHNSRNDQFDTKQLNFDMMSSSSSSSHNPLSSHLYTTNQGMIIRPFHLSMNPKPFSSEENKQERGN